LRNFAKFGCLATLWVLAILETSNCFASTAAKKTTVLDAIHMLSRAWQAVKVSTIKHCFEKALAYGAEAEPAEVEPFDALEDVPIPTNMTAEDFVELLDSEEVDDISEADEDKKEESDEEEEAVPETVSALECLEALKVVSGFCQRRLFSPVTHESLRRIENECVTERTTAASKQQRITEFFK